LLPKSPAGYSVGWRQLHTLSNKGRLPHQSLPLCSGVWENVYAQMAKQSEYGLECIAVEARRTHFAASITSRLGVLF
jgi:hypothetical protein